MNILYINTSISKIIAAGLERTTIGLYYRDFTLSAPPGPIMIFMILFNFRAPSVNLFNRKRCHIGIRIFIRIIYYPINGYPDSKLSVLSIPTQQLKTSIQIAQRPRITYFRPILREENSASWQRITYSASRTFSADFRRTKIQRRIRLTDR